MEYVIGGAGLVVALFTCTGLVLTWRKNGRDQDRRDERIAANQENIIKKLDDDETGLSALNTKVGSIQTHCAGVTSGFGERIKGTEADIKELKSKKSRSRS